MDEVHFYDEVGLEKTLNGYGYMHTESEYTKKFIEYSEYCSGNLLDVGCAYGVSTIPCLKNKSNVYACDIDIRHLDTLERRVPEEFRTYLHKINKRFPDETNFANEFFDAVMISHVLSFLTPEEIDLGIAKIHDWLKSDGKLFIVNYTPYHKTLQDFIPIYENKKERGDRWPGLVQNKDHYGNSNYLKNNLPDNFLLLDVEILAELALKNGFLIEECKYMGSASNYVPEPFRLDGREWVGLIATKA